MYGYVTLKESSLNELKHKILKTENITTETRNFTLENRTNLE